MGNDSTIVTFNCKSIKRSVECIRELCRAADIIALQETWLLPQDIPFLSTIHSDFQYAAKSAVDTGVGILRGRPFGGVALLWRKSVFKNVTVVECRSTRIVAIKVKLLARCLLIVNVYMPIDSAENLAEYTECLGEISAIVEECKIDTVFMLGDFNAQPGSRFGEELKDFCLEQNWKCADIDILGRYSDSFTYISDVHHTKSWLDHCVVSEAGWNTVLDARIRYDVFWSDHFPLEIKCNFDLIRPENIVSSRKEFNNVLWGDRNQEQIKLYHDLCDSKLNDLNCDFCDNCDNSCNNLEHMTLINEMYLNIVSILRNASSKSYKCKVFKKHRHVVGWNRYVRQAHTEARLGFQNWVLYGRPRLGLVYNTMLNTRKAFKTKLKWCQDNAERIKLDIIASYHTQKDFGRFWKQTSKLSPRSSLPVSVEGVSEPAQIAQLFKDHFKIDPPLGTADESSFSRKSGIDAQTTFSANDVLAAIKSMTRGKSPGHDSLSLEHLQYAGYHLPVVLAKLFNYCLKHSYLPEDMMMTLVVPIVKNRGDASAMKNYRPISLATVIAKVLDSVLDKQLDQHLAFNDAQFGFRSGLSTESAVLCLKHTVRYYTDRKTPVYACFLDLSKAFDMVSYDKLWKKLYMDTTLPVESIELLRFWYGHQTNAVKWAGSLSERYRLECGVRQGGITSPKLFSLYINRLLEELSSTMVGCSIDGTFVNNISYADDMVLLSPSISALRQMLAICERYADSHGLRYNADKSELLVFRAGAKHYSEVPPVTIRGTPLKIVSEFKYLGHWVTADQTDDMDVERERRALAIRSNMLIRRFGRCTKGVKRTLFGAYCQTFYTCSLWVSCTQRAYSVLRVQYNNAFRMLMGLPRYCSASGMFAEERIDDFYAIMRKRVASLWRRVRASSNSILRTVAERVDGPYCKHRVKLHVLPSNRAAK